jgi:outer membrane lipoprotein-sorting protein
MRRAWVPFLAGMLVASVGTAAELEPAPEGLDARTIAERQEQVLRGDRAYMEAAMTVASPRLLVPRTVEFRSWDDRLGKRSFIRILAPPKDADSAFLMKRPNMWMYVPRVERTMRIPPSMMLQSWMGSDFTNDDLVRESSQLDDYDHRLLGVDPSPEGHPERRAYVVEFMPHEDAPVVWGRVVSWIDVETYTPLLQEFYDEDGTKLRRFELGDVREVQGRHFPHRWSMQPLEKPEHRTSIEIRVIRFDEAFDDRIFTTRNLKERR